jgi:predicted ATPase/DNA-binding SARP family transcriptional activator
MPPGPDAVPLSADVGNRSGRGLPVPCRRLARDNGGVGDRLEVALLGPVEARVDGVTVTLPGVPPRVLLARLALAAGRAVPTAELMASLWVGDPPANAEGNLHSYVSRLRRAIGAEAVVREPGGYRLQVEPTDVDVGRAGQLANAAQKAAPTEPARAASLLGEALRLWRGEPLMDLAEPLAFAPDLARLSAWRRQLEVQWFELGLDAGDAAALLPDLERATATEPTDEGTHLLLMRALHQVGRTAEALRVGEGLRRRMVEESGLDPSPALGELERRILGDDAELRPAPRPPRVRDHSARRAPGDRFVDRGRDLALLEEAVGDHRLVTVVGPGGVGKSRLAMELLDHVTDAVGAQLVELAKVSDGTDVPAAVAAALGLQAAPAGLGRAIADRLALDPTLVLLDNCEHVIDAVGDLVIAVLDGPDVRVLATSRRPLGLPGEKVIRLDPLDPAAQVELFCDRAALWRADFDPATTNRGVAADICALVDGLPLGIELAARREAVFGLGQLRDRLASGLDVIESVGRGTRATALTAAVEWSYSLLDADAQALFDRLAVCQAGCGLDAVDHLAPPGGRNPAVLLAELVEASLVTTDFSVDPPRYRLLETIRQVGLAHLSDEEQGVVRDAHAGWMQSHVDAIHRLQSVRSPDATALLRCEVANLREALSWLIDSGRTAAAARLAIALCLAVTDDPHIDLLAQFHRLEAAVSHIEPPAVVAGEACIAAAMATCLEGDATATDRLLTQALAQLPDGHHSRWTGNLLNTWLGIITGDRSRADDHAHVLLSEAQAPAWARANAVCCAALLHHFAADARGARAWVERHEALLAEVAEVDGFVAYTQGELAAATDPESALRCFDQAYRQCDKRGHTSNRAIAAIGRAAVLIRLGRHPEAVVECRRLIGELQRMGLWPQLWIVLRLTAELLVALGDPEPAAMLLAAADADPLAPAVLRVDRERHTALWVGIGEALASERLEAAKTDGAARGRAAVAHLAVVALDQHG